MEFPLDVATLTPLIRQNGFVFESRIAGNSMIPTLPPGTKIRIDGGSQAPEIGQVVAFRWGAGLTAHRVVVRNKGFIVTRGDGQKLCDPPVPLGDIVGVVNAWWNDNRWCDLPARPAPAAGDRAGLVLARALLAIHPAAARYVAAGVSAINRRIPTRARIRSAPATVLVQLLSLRRTADVDFPTSRREWEMALRAATPSLHRYLAHRLGEAGWADRPPPSIRARLAEALRASSISSALRTQEAHRAVQALDAGGVPNVLLKGMALAHTVYPSPALRPMQDIDVWVPPDRLDQAVALLETAGFPHPPHTYHGLLSPQDRDVTAAERVLMRPGVPVVVEIRGTLASFAGAPEIEERAWNRARPADIGGRPVRVLNHEDLLLHVGLHLGRTHRFQLGLRGLLDLALIVDHWKESWDWPALIRDYRGAGITVRMQLALKLARDLVGAPVPDAVFEVSPAGDEFPRLEELARRQVWSADAPLPFAIERLVAGHGNATERGRRWFGSGPREGLRRLAFDLKTKIPIYGRWLIREGWRGGAVIRRIRAVRAAARLEARIQASE